MVALGALAVLLASLTRYGYRATTVGLLLAASGHLWAGGAVLGLTLARYGYYLYFHRGGGHGEKEHNE
jgi:hypothetical protein